MLFLVLVLGLLVGSIVLGVYSSRKPLPRRLTRQERMYYDLMFLQAQQNAIEEDRRMSDRMRNY